jgi:acyl-CoA dehydrogenase
MAAEAAFQLGARIGRRRWLAAAVAKARASEAAGLVADTAHAVHGAIGVTQEYDLQLYTRRLRAWRVAHGSEAHWNQRIGEQVLAGTASVLDTIRG